MISMYKWICLSQIQVMRMSSWWNCGGKIAPKSSVKFSIFVPLTKGYHCQEKVDQTRTLCLSSINQSASTVAGDHQQLLCCRQWRMEHATSRNTYTPWNNSGIFGIDWLFNKFVSKVLRKLLYFNSPGEQFKKSKVFLNILRFFEIVIKFLRGDPSTVFVCGQRR